MSSDTVRNLERKFKKPKGWMDNVPSVQDADCVIDKTLKENDSHSMTDAVIMLMKLPTDVQNSIKTMIVSLSNRYDAEETTVPHKEKTLSRHVKTEIVKPQHPILGFKEKCVNGN